jgi:VWFA-related protein
MTTGHHLLGMLGCAVATAAVVSGNTQNTERPAAPFYARADLVTLPVTVTDQRDQYVADLDAMQFQIFENGRPQSLEFFQSTAVPLTLTLVLDTSASMNSRLSAITEGAVEFTRDLDPDDVVSVIAFNERVRVLSEFTSSHDALERAIRGAERLHEPLYRNLCSAQRVGTSGRGRADDTPSTRNHSAVGRRG